MLRRFSSSFVATLAVLLCTVPALDRPPHVDDANFLILARGARLDPLRPHAISINWQGTTERAFDVLSNPPGIAWWLAPVVDASDLVRHLWMWPWLLLACWGAGRLGDRVAGRPAVAILLLCASPAAMLAATAWTPDLPLLACTLAGMAGLLAPRAPGGSRLPWAVLLGMGACFRYSGLALIPLAGLWPALRRDARGAAQLTIAAALPTLALALHDVAVYGEWHVLAMTRFQGIADTPRDITRKLIAAIATLVGGLALPILAAARPRRALGGALVGLALGCVGALLSAQAGATAAWTLLWTAAGGAVLGSVLSRTQRLDVFFVCWLFGGLLFLLKLRFTATRYWLPFAAPAILAVLPLASRSLRTTAVVATTALALAISLDDHAMARAHETLAREVDAAVTALGIEDRRFSGHWGLQHHLEARGWSALEEDSPIPPGVAWARTSVAWPQDPGPGCRTPIETFERAPSGWRLRSHTAEIAGNIHAHVLSASPPIEVYAPFGLGRDPYDSIQLTIGAACPAASPPDTPSPSEGSF